ncbi:MULTISPECIES: 3-oxoacyl-ACP synthase III family protein [Butyricimonas]|uniref:3-oxoacyl-ACP synthase III family protein n=1 Tax=Butyricimonas TaxID=574697 RepID=UPI002084FF4F|nr:ketoacyl-ACP synthase III [Butyricimonas paravirosa]BDF55649.1 3-oxoacyl-ACP synthase [Odoribacteraceae bacterium]GKH94514.1 3-oxoacyl-ACP synthase [Odoribacteraceae bacterium]GKI00572.1 3-oxoacyl-ACP synthase [Odoribacteraceae bacterium]GKI02068.1 3-oxoacyl-ACP synthase [Odoribacteraceae bacterium]
MARWEIKNVRVTGVAAAVPRNVVYTTDFDFFTPEEAGVFNNTVGIKQRHIAPEDVCASDLCFAAAEQLLADLKWERESVDILIFESVTGDYKTPPTSCLLQDRLGLSEDCFAMDIPMGCCGCMYAITTGGNLLSSGNVKRALLLIGDTALRMGSMKDKSRVPLFGDCGTAMALEYDPTASDIVVDFHTYGKGYEALMTPHGGFRHPVTKESFEYEDFGNGIVRAPLHTLINGMNVFSFAISKPPRSIETFMTDYGIDKERDVDYFLIHQANKMIVDRIVKKLKLPLEKVPYNLEEFGNLGGASIPSLMVTRLREQLMTGEKSLLMSSFGLGLTWGTMWIKTKPMVISEMVVIK